MSISRNYYHNRKAGKNNPKGTNYTPSLTRDRLVELGITVEGTDIYQYEKQRAQCLFNSNPGPYTDGTYYYKVHVKLGKNKYTNMLAHRIIYVWYYGDIPNGMVVDHIDNNHLNNDPRNLVLMSRADNTKKNSVGHNQFTYRDKWSEDEYDKQD